MRASEPSDALQRQDLRGKPNQKAPCVWKEDEDGVWHTDCGNAFVFNDSGPKENHMAFCGYCGRKLKAKKASDMR